SNSIRNAGAQALAESLKTNSTLITLNLDSNLIDDNGAHAMAKVLFKANLALIILTLENNSIGDNGAETLKKVSRATTRIIIC
ncbi:hypothetical protein BGZ93_000216, partial [Podila epicladia]